MDYTQCVESVLDEAHLKVGVRALARLHALSLVQIARDSGPDLRLEDTRWRTGDRAGTEAGLKQRWNTVVNTLEGTLVERAKTMSSALYGLYREAAHIESSLTVLCHGQPTLRNIVFLYKDGIPTEAKFVDFSHARFASAATDLLTFIHSTGEVTVREDFLIRFVYYESLISTMKSLGMKEAAIEYDDLKAECLKKRQYGYLESAMLLASTGTKSSTPAVLGPRGGGGREVESKILGTFIPRAKISAVSALTGSSKEQTLRSRVTELVERALATK